MAPPAAPRKSPPPTCHPQAGKKFARGENCELRSLGKFPTLYPVGGTETGRLARGRKSGCINTKSYSKSLIMKYQHRAAKGFTLVELLVVITIIALLASIAMPVFTSVQMNGRMTKAAAQARGIHIALTSFAGDNDGAFPAAQSTSNDAYRQLIPDYIDSEKPFGVSGSAWHKGSRNDAGPDDDIGNKPDYSTALERGENHWAYVSGLRNDSTSNLPVIADGFTESPGTYLDDPNKKGGVWKGTKAIIVYAGGAAAQEKINKRSFKVEKVRNGSPVDIFSSDFGTDPSNVRNPEG
jgi:prepilin-type N-terminal cleavage/methylation domain-containing protein